MKNFKSKALDLYVDYALLIDLLINSVVIFILYKFSDKFHVLSDRKDLDELISNIISTIVSFTGFILASLTL